MEDNDLETDKKETNETPQNKNEITSKKKDAPAKKTSMRKKSQKDIIKGLEGEISDSNDKLIRLRAEFDNYRKRMQREMSEIRTLTKIGTIEEILPVKDQFQMAMTAANTSDDLATLKQGMNMILAEFDRCFGNLNIESIETDGKKFDPKVHEAISTESAAEVEEGHIIREWKMGYKIGDHLLRPASVVVSNGAESDEKSQNSNDDYGHESILDG